MDDRVQEAVEEAAGNGGLKNFDIDQRRTWLASSAGALVGSFILMIEVATRPFYFGSNGLFSGLMFFAFMSFLFLLPITYIVEIAAHLVRPKRTALSFIASLFVAALISFPFWPPELLGQPRWKGEDPRHWVSMVFAGVTAVVWWWLLPTPEQRRK